MKSISKTYYHIQNLDNRRPEWKKGNEYFIDNSELNWFNKLLESNLEDYRLVNGNEKVGLIKYINNYLLNDINNKYSKEQTLDKNQFLETFIIDLQDSLSQYLKWIQEDIFERIRENNYTSLPSRKHCIWVCEKEQLPNWWSEFCPSDTKFKTPRKKILKLKLKGKFHKANGLLIDSDTYKIDDFELRAKKYWAGIIESENKIEILFMGKVKVLEEYPNIDVLNNLY